MPGEMPFTIPVVAPTVAMIRLLLVHVPPATESYNILEEPMHILFIPQIADGDGFTVKNMPILQPVGRV